MKNTVHTQIRHITKFSKNVKFRAVLLQTSYKEMYRRTQCPPAIHFFVKIAIFVLLYFLAFEADLYSSKLHSFKFNMANLPKDPVFSFHLKISDILKRDVILKKSYFMK